MDQNSLNTRRIAKNTLMLYVRMLFMMFLGLFTSRIVLEALGENDFGIYDVVGGVVAMFSLISGSLTTAVTRFITFEMGKGEGAQLNKVYSNAVVIQLLLAVLIAVIAEPVGLWYIDNKMTIDPLRIPAARMVLHFSILAFMVNLMSVPQMASITAHEKMSAYAYIGILEGVLKFAVALAIANSSSDRLVMYSVLMALSVVVVRSVYSLYCRRNFPECRYRPGFDKGLFKEMSSFAGWNFIGIAASVIRDYGGTILINLFYGPAVNAARAIALQLNNAVQGFVKNFMTAVNPQITKLFASGDTASMLALVRKSSKISYYLLLILVLPIIFNVDFLLNLWLKEVPEYSAVFVVLFLIFTLSECIANPMVTATLATGRIKINYIIGILVMLNLPVSYICLKAGAAPESILVVAIILSQICLIARFLILKYLVKFPARDFLVKVYLNVIVVTVISVILPYIVYVGTCDDFKGFIIRSLTCLVSVGLTVLYVGLSRTERKELREFITIRRK